MALERGRHDNREGTASATRTGHQLSLWMEVNVILGRRMKRGLLQLLVLIKIQ